MWYEISKAKELLEGDNNTEYFHLIANRKYIKNQIYKLEDGGNIIHKDANVRASPIISKLILNLIVLASL
jgi:hypothetical protein